LFEEVGIEEEIVVPRDDNFVVMRLGLKLVERAFLGKVSGVDEEVAGWQTGLAVMCV
jgi:hypothetical protein